MDTDTSYMIGPGTPEINMWRPFASITMIEANRLGPVFWRRCTLIQDSIDKVAIGAGQNHENIRSFLCEAFRIRATGKLWKIRIYWDPETLAELTQGLVECWSLFLSRAAIEDTRESLCNGPVEEAGDDDDDDENDA